MSVEYICGFIDFHGSILLMGIVDTELLPELWWLQSMLYCGSSAAAAVAIDWLASWLAG